MEKKELFEQRRQRLLALVEERLNGSKAKLAEALGISSSYVYRMFYEEGKKGKKNIGDDMVRLIESKFDVSLDQVRTQGLSAMATKVGQAFDNLTRVEQNAILGVLSGFGVKLDQPPAKEGYSLAYEGQGRRVHQSSESS